jgi:hemerythrin
MLEWTADLAINVLDIDGQHQELFKRINRFFEAVDRRAGNSELKEFFLFLEDYVITHFRTEEGYMDRHLGYDYPDFERHKSQHQAFIRDFREFSQDLDNPEVSELIVTEFRDWMRNWWLLHINNIDKGLGRSLQSALMVFGKPPQPHHP